jgi:hypothetical protein
MERGRLMGFQADVRAASVTLLSDYASDAGVKLQVYPARPRSIFPPTAFVDLIRETIEYVGITLRQRSPAAEIVVIHGIFDSKDAADQKDAFVDGFLDWVTDRYHTAGANTLVAVTATEDMPNYVPEWMPPAEQLVYYATRLTLEGFAGS